MKTFGVCLALFAMLALPVVAAADSCYSRGYYGGNYYNQGYNYNQNYNYDYNRTFFEYLPILVTVPLYAAGYIPPPEEKKVEPKKAAANEADPRLKALEDRVNAQDKKLDAILAALTGQKQPAQSDSVARQDAPPARGPKAWQRQLAANCLSCHGNNGRGGFTMTKADGVSIRDDFTGYEFSRITTRILGPSKDVKTGKQLTEMPPPKQKGDGTLEHRTLSPEVVTDILEMAQDVKQEAKAEARKD